MKKVTFLLLFPIILIATIAIYMWNNQPVSAQTLLLNTRDIPEQGLLIIGPEHTSYENKFTELIATKTTEQKNFMTALKPFSAFISNSNTKDVIAYKVRWEISGVNTKAIVYDMTFADPAILMGVDPSLVTSETRNLGHTVISNTSKFVSVASSVNNSQQQSISFGSGGDSGNPNDPRSASESELLERLQRDLENAASITITLDGAMFEDGTFVGPDNSGYFNQLKAQINAKYDLLNGILKALQQNKQPTEIYATLQAFVEAPEITLSTNSTPTEYYNFYRGIYATEILEIRTAFNNDEQSLSYILTPLKRSWLNLHKVE